VGLFLSLCRGGGLLLAAFALFGCRATRSTTAEHRYADSIAVEARKAESLTSTESVSDYIREVIVMQADTAGELRPVWKMVEKSRNEEKQKTAENTQKLDSAAFSSENDRIILQEKEKPVERPKTRFWMWAFFILLGLAAIGVGVVFLWRKTLWKWM
jgi:hypothetical protein